MKTYALSILMNVLIVVSLQGKIKNGYEAAIMNAHEGLKNLTQLSADRNLSSREKKRINENIIRHREFILYYELTGRLLSQFKLIAPEIYNAIDTIKDANGTFVDVYVRFEPLEAMRGQVVGSTNMPTAEGNVYSSKYGVNTASVRIIMGDNALRILAHEFGHIHFQVPNLVVYKKFYARTYKHNVSGSEGIGHHLNDPSGSQAFKFEKLFHAKHVVFLKVKKNREENPIAIMNEISKELNQAKFRLDAQGT